jgi:single-strand DNA-binding protein
MGINHITVMGHIARGPEFRMTPNGVPTCNFSLAVTRPPRQDGGAEITDYMRVVTWRQLAEKVNETVQKGALVVVEGRLTTRSYEKDGQRRKTIEIEASAVSPVQGAAKVVGEPEPEFESEPEPVSAAPARKPAAPPPAADLDDEIPF